MIGGRFLRIRVEVDISKTLGLFVTLAGEWDKDDLWVTKGQTKIILWKTKIKCISGSRVVKMAYVYYQKVIFLRN